MKPSRFLLRAVNLLSPLSNFVMERVEAWQLIQLYKAIVKRKLYFRARVTNFEILMLSTLIFLHSKIDSYYLQFKMG